MTGEPGMAINGSLAGRPLNFFQLQEGNWVALQGVHAMTEPGIYPLIITGTLSSGAPLAFSQAALVNSGDYPFDPVITVNSEMIDPAVTKPEGRPMGCVNDSCDSGTHNGRSVYLPGPRPV